MQLQAGFEPAARLPANHPYGAPNVTPHPRATNRLFGFPTDLDVLFLAGKENDNTQTPRGRASGRGDARGGGTFSGLAAFRSIFFSGFPLNV